MKMQAKKLMENQVYILSALRDRAVTRETSLMPEKKLKKNIINY